MSDNTINAGLRRLGYSTDEMTAHGFRAMASTLLNESGKWHPDAIKRALVHGDSGRVRAAYYRGASGRVGCEVWIGFWRFNGTHYVGHWPFAEWIACAVPNTAARSARRNGGSRPRPGR